MGTEKVGVTEVVGVPTLVTVRVARGEDVAVMKGVDAGDVRDGVNIACKVSAAAVWTSFGGGSCSNGILQASMARISPAPATTDLKFCVINMYSFLRTAEWETLALFYHFQPSGFQTTFERNWEPRGTCTAGFVEPI
jgi:hypothetical protein